MTSAMDDVLLEAFFRAVYHHKIRLSECLIYQKVGAVLSLVPKANADTPMQAADRRGLPRSVGWDPLCVFALRSLR